MSMNESKRYYLIFSLYFLGFGVLIAGITSFVNYQSKFTDIQKDLYDISVQENAIKRSLLKGEVDRIEQLLHSIAASEITQFFTIDQSDINRKNITDLFFTLSRANTDIMQLRYLNERGKEVVRIDRSKLSEELTSIEKTGLQDKSKRYYFKEAKNLRAHEFWHSNIDLNIENGKIEQPIRPTFRVATPLIIQNKFKGVIIVNFMFERFLNQLTNSANFNVYLFDNKGEVILHPTRKYSWSRYLRTGASLNTIFPEHVKNISTQKEFMGDGYFAFTLGDLFKNSEKIKVVYVPRREAMDKMQDKNIFAAFIIAITVIIISIPLSWLISIIPSKLQSNLAQAYQKIQKSSRIINKHIIISNTDANGVILDVSDRFVKVSGYSREEIIGKKHNVLRHPDTRNETYREMWSTIEVGEVWDGEIQDLNKAGEPYWIHMHIAPEMNENNTVSGYTAISQDITDKKMIEYISITDSLTGLFNRRKVDEVLASEVARFDRYQTPFSVLIFDVDYFKKVNDEHGHLVGDAVLVLISQILQANSRLTDCISRWGGEEFLIVASGMGLNDAAQYGEKLRKTVEEHQFSDVGTITISCGVAEYSKSVTSSELVSLADNALYNAKNSGRNRVIKS